MRSVRLPAGTQRRRGAGACVLVGALPRNSGQTSPPPSEQTLSGRRAGPGLRFRKTRWDHPHSSRPWEAQGLPEALAPWNSPVFIRTNLDVSVRAEKTREVTALRSPPDRAGLGAAGQRSPTWPRGHEVREGRPPWAWLMGSRVLEGPASPCPSPLASSPIVFASHHGGAHAPSLPPP